jgi:hypothetical protein
MSEYKMKIACYVDYYDGGDIIFFKNNIYECSLTNDVFYRIINSNNLAIYIMKYKFDSYFMTLKEYRKYKLKKIRLD